MTSDRKGDTKGSEVIEVVSPERQDQMCSNDEAAGCLDRGSTSKQDRAYLDSRYSDEHNVYHELMHHNGNPQFHHDFGEYGDNNLRVSEGVTEYFTRQVAPQSGYSTPPYSSQVNVVESLLRNGYISEESLKRAYFGGNRAAMQELRRALHKAGHGPNPTHDLFNN